MNIKTTPGGADVLTEQNGSAISELGEMPKLVPCVGLSNWIRAWDERIS
jgi:hypothetical protein